VCACSPTVDNDGVVRELLVPLAIPPVPRDNETGDRVSVYRLDDQVGSGEEEVALDEDSPWIRYHQWTKIQVASWIEEISASITIYP